MKDTDFKRTDRDRAKFVERQLHECAEKRDIVLELRITDEPWFK